ncbi:MAG: hypothetical protein KDB22_27945 [Planctomycetales bacterium]|nr:hypothetical protein [Planctomycetales bacterium]
MRSIAFVVAWLGSSLLGQLANGSSPEEIPEVFDLYVTEVELTGGAEPVAAGEIDAAYEQWLESGKINKRETCRVAISQDREFEFLHMYHIKLSEVHVNEEGLATTRLNSATIGSTIKVSLLSENNDMKLKLDYFNYRPAELTPATKLTDIESVKAKIEVLIVPRRRMILPANSVDGRTYLVVWLSPKQKDLQP